jgi:hypothetical protein
MGSVLAVFDWLFGTLHIPSKEREKLTFGVKPHASEGAHDPHTLKGAVINPFIRSSKHIVGAIDGAKEAANPQAAVPSTLPRS